MKALILPVPDDFTLPKHAMVVTMEENHKVERFSAEIRLCDVPDEIVAAGESVKNGTLGDAIIMTTEAKRLFELQSFIRHLEEALRPRQSRIIT